MPIFMAVVLDIAASMFIWAALTTYGQTIEAKPVIRKSRKTAAKPRRRTDRQVAQLKRIAAQAFVPPRVTKQGRPDRRYKAARLTNDNTVDA
jgi:hypothetical protein